MKPGTPPWAAPKLAWRVHLGEIRRNAWRSSRRLITRRSQVQILPATRGVRHAYPSPLPSLRWHVLEDEAEIAEADCGIHSLGHRRRLHARGYTSAGERVMEVERGQRGAESAPPSAVKGRDVVDAAVAREGERHRSCDVFVFEARDEDVVCVGVGSGEEVRWHAREAQVLRPVGGPELDLGPGRADLV